MKNKILEIFAAIAVIVLVCSLIYLVEVERSENIAKTKEINSLKSELKTVRTEKVELSMKLEAYENKLSKFHISNLEQLGLPKKEDK